MQAYEMLIRAQNVVNTESLLPQFIVFAKNTEEMRKKWQQSESRCKELQNQLNLEKSIYQRKINELKYVLLLVFFIAKLQFQQKID